MTGSSRSSSSEEEGRHKTKALSGTIMNTVFRVPVVLGNRGLSSGDKPFFELKMQRTATAS